MSSNLLGKYVTAGTVRGNWMTQGLVIEESNGVLVVLHEDGNTDRCRAEDAVVVTRLAESTAAWVKRECERRGI